MTPQKFTAIVLPSLDPDEKFIGVVEGLIWKGFEHIVIVDDGSDEAHQHYFEAASVYPQCSILHHGVNKGKGRALKTAFSYIQEHLPEMKGVITIDGDGQHLADDIVACGKRMLSEGDKVVLGSRDFNQPGVPPRSVAGNKFTARMFRLLFGIKINDTQTGLRAIPVEYLEQFCRIEGERFEYETNMLLQMKRLGIQFVEQPIATVYDPEDYSSHYNAFRDSFKVGKVMAQFLISGSGFRYVISSLLSYLVDTAIYGILFVSLGSSAKVIAQLAARVLSSFFNFNMNRSFAYRSKGNYLKEVGKYYCLCVPTAIVSLILVPLAQNLGNVTSVGIAILVKTIIEAVIYIFNYIFQKKWVFRK